MACSPCALPAPLPPLVQAALETARKKRLNELLQNHCKKALGHITSHKVRRRWQRLSILPGQAAAVWQKGISPAQSVTIVRRVVARLVPPSTRLLQPSTLFLRAPARHCCPAVVLALQRSSGPAPVSRLCGDHQEPYGLWHRQAVGAMPALYCWGSLGLASTCPEVAMDFGNVKRWVQWLLCTAKWGLVVSRMAVVEGPMGFGTIKQWVQRKHL